MHVSLYWLAVCFRIFFLVVLFLIQLRVLTLLRIEAILVLAVSTQILRSSAQSPYETMAADAAEMAGADAGAGNGTTHMSNQPLVEVRVSGDESVTSETATEISTDDMRVNFASMPAEQLPQMHLANSPALGIPPVGRSRCDLQSAYRLKRADDPAAQYHGRSDSTPVHWAHCTASHAESQRRMGNVVRSAKQRSLQSRVIALPQQS